MKKALFFLVLFFLSNQCFAQKKGHVPGSPVYTWSGTLNGTIPVFMWYILKDSTIYGELTYTHAKQPAPIRIIGAFSDLDEYDKDGNVTGVWSGAMKNNFFIGKWVSPRTGKELPFLLSRTDTTVNADTSLEAVNIDGAYRYTYPDGASGEIDAKRIDAKHIVFNIGCTTRGPAYNQAQIDDDTVMITGHTAIYHAKNESGICEFSIDFYKTFAGIGYTCDTCNQCDFGLNADVGGIFVKISSKTDIGKNTK